MVPQSTCNIRLTHTHSHTHTHTHNSCSNIILFGIPILHRSMHVIIIKHAMLLPLFEHMFNPVQGVWKCVCVCVCVCVCQQYPMPSQHQNRTVRLLYSLMSLCSIIGSCERISLHGNKTKQSVTYVRP